MQLPIIHLNGTSRARLLSDYSIALAAAQSALSAFQSIEFNARDYYPAGPGAFDIAREEHAHIARRLAEVCEDLDVFVAHLEGNAE